MIEPTARSAARCHHDTDYCSRCDLLVGLGEPHVTAVEFDHDDGVFAVAAAAPCPHLALRSGYSAAGSY